MAKASQQKRPDTDEIVLSTCGEPTGLSTNIIERARNARQRMAETRARQLMEVNVNKARHAEGKAHLAPLVRLPHEDWLGTLTEAELALFISFVKAGL